MNIETLKVLADTYMMFFKAQSYHWNVKGSRFPEVVH